MPRKLPPSSATKLSSAGLAEKLFDLMPDTVFFIKDAEGRYVAVNQSLVKRCGCKHKRELLGRTVADMFPEGLGAGYAEQDQSVLNTGQPILGKLELHLYPDNRRGWCLTSKIPLRENGRVIGLAGYSHDIGAPDEDRVIPSSLLAAIEHLQEHYDRDLTINDMAARAGLPPSQFVRLIKRIFGLTPGQLLIQTRIQAATVKLTETSASIAQIALACGFSDQSAFTRRFKAVTGCTPLQYRATEV